MATHTVPVRLANFPLNDEGKAQAQRLVSLLSARYNEHGNVFELIETALCWGVIYNAEVPFKNCTVPMYPSMVDSRMSFSHGYFCALRM